MSDTEEIECALTWELARNHGWSLRVAVKDLVSDANVLNEQEGRRVARDILPDRPFIGYHQGKDEIWLQNPHSTDAAYFVRDTCAYLEIQIEATFDSYFDGFD